MHEPTTDDRDAPNPDETPAKAKNRANELSGSDWTKFSISIWSDIRFTPQERQLGHPAMFPTMLVDRLLRCFTTDAETVVLDPFMGSGSTMVAAKHVGKAAIGFDVYDAFIQLARERLRQDNLFATSEVEPIIHRADSRHLSELIPSESVDFCVTSPPYWDILTQKRSADGKETRNYGDQQNDLGWIREYDGFLDELQQVFGEVFKVLRPGKYCVVNVMDLRKGPNFFPLHADLARRMATVGFVFDDTIIWDRRHDYNNLRSLGFPYTFRINKVHEFLLIFQKPKTVEPAVE